MRAAERLGNDSVDDAELDQVLGGDLHARRRLLRARGIAPENRGGRFGRGHGVDCVFEHQHGVAGGDRERAAGAALADNHSDVGHAQRKTRVDRAGDGFGLAALLGFDAGESASGVDERNHRQAEAVGKLHEPRRLAIALRAGHAEIVAHAARRVVAFLLAEEADRFALESSQAPDDRFVLAEIAVAGERRELGDEPLDVVAETRTPLRARHQRLLPGRQGGVEIGQRLFGSGLEPADFLGERRRIAFLRHGAHFVETGLDVGDRRFEAEIGAHPVLAANRTGGRRGARKLARGGGEVKPTRDRVPPLRRSAGCGMNGA